MSIRTKFDAELLVINKIENELLPFSYELPNGAGSKTSYFLNSQQFMKPGHIGWKKPANGCWIRLTMNDLVTEDQEATGCLRTVTGFLTLDVFQPKETGTFAANSIAEHFRKNLSNLYLNTLKIYQLTISELPDNDFLRLALTGNYTYEGRTDGS